MVKIFSYESKFRYALIIMLAVIFLVIYLIIKNVGGFDESKILIHRTENEFQLELIDAKYLNSGVRSLCSIQVRHGVYYVAGATAGHLEFDAAKNEAVVLLRDQAKYAIKIRNEVTSKQ